MTAEQRVIDLDAQGDVVADPDEAPRRRRPIGRPPGPYIIGAFVLGATLGGIGGAQLQASREEQTRAATVAVTAVASSAKGDGRNSGGMAQFDAQVTVVNAGPQPVTVRAAEARFTGIDIRPTDSSSRLRPAAAGVIDIQLVADCSIGHSSLPLRLSVETADHRTHLVNVEVWYAGSVWHDRARSLCGQTG
ncbi:hypothetical protein [Micromonospora sp. NPDC006431]|uniref:hypothetical protein n=1 Tax=Micromonospora sp. NPDC006431 TaxID=3364235 RepID=UPI00369D5A2B